MKMTIKTHKFWLYTIIVLGFLTLPLVGIGLIFLTAGFFLRSKKIEVANMDVKYSSWFSKTSIKQLESIDIFFIPFLPIFNSVTITGRGTQKIKMRNVAKVKEVKEFASKIDELRHDH